MIYTGYFCTCGHIEIQNGSGYIAVFVIIFLLTFSYLRKRSNLPPGPFNWPLIGCVEIIRKIKRQRPHLVMMDLAKEYGPVFSFRMGKQPIVVLNGYDAIHEALVKRAEDFSNRPNHLPLFKLAVQNGHGIVFNNYNHNWKVLRRFTLQALRDFGVGKSTLEEKIMTEIDATSKEFVRHGDTPVDINTFLNISIGNVILGIVFGVRYDYGDPEFDNVRLLACGFFQGDGILNLANYLPESVIKLIITMSKQISYESRHALFKKAEAFVEKRIIEHEITFDENVVRDFIDLHIKTTREKNESHNDGLSRNGLTKTILDLFVAGLETTSTGLDWAFLYMAEFPDVQKRCQMEIDEMLGDKPIHYADRDKVPYLNAALLETQRMGCIAPLSFVHCAAKDSQLYGFDIPVDTVILPNLYSACYDPKYFSEPDIFKPERFLDVNGRLVKTEALIPFSTGPRQCIGEPLAKMELFLFFANLLQRFNFRRERDGVKHSLKSRMYQTSNAPEPYRLRIESRKTD